MMIINRRDANGSKRHFSNTRDWRSTISALQEAAAYPKVRDAVKSGRAWFTEGAAQASNWLVGTPAAAETFSAG
jgi:hypothetical protein